MMIFSSKDVTFRFNRRFKNVTLLSYCYCITGIPKSVDLNSLIK